LVDSLNGKAEDYASQEGGPAPIRMLKPCNSLLISAHLRPPQAFISYGPLSNDDLAARYGFVQTDNREDSFVFDDLFGWLRTNYDAAKALSPKQLQALDKDGTLKV